MPARRRRLVASCQSFFPVFPAAFRFHYRVWHAMHSQPAQPRRSFPSICTMAAPFVLAKPHFVSLLLLLLYSSCSSFLPCLSHSPSIWLMQKRQSVKFHCAHLAHTRSTDDASDGSAGRTYSASVCKTEGLQPREAAAEMPMERKRKLSGRE